MKDTTIVIPNRDGKNINIVIKRLKELYKNSKILVISQVDDRPFCKGQLLNIAIQKVSTKYVMFLDNDILLEEYVNLEKIYEKNNCKVIQPFSQISQVYIDQDNQVHKLYTDQRNFAHFNDIYNIEYGVSCGGCTFMSVENFKKVNGFSNLYIGWGQEDNEFYLRCNRSFISLSLTINHIKHESRAYHNTENLSILNRYKSFNKTKDGYNDTTYKLKEVRVIDDVTYIDVYNVYVKDDFLYKNVLDYQYKRYGEASINNYSVL